MLDFAVPYIEAFKTGATEPGITTEMLVYWYRPHLKAANCDSTDNCGTKPTGWNVSLFAGMLPLITADEAESLNDSVFVAAMTKSGGSITVTSGSEAPVTSSVGAGVQVFEVPMGVGTQSFQFCTNEGKSGSATSNVTISADCWVSSPVNNGSC